MTPSQPSPTNLSDELKTILDKHAEYYIRETMRFFQNEGVSPALSKDNPGDLNALAAITAAYAEAINEVIGEDEYSIDPLWAGQRGYWARNELRAEQRQRLQGLLPNGKDE